MFRILSLLYLAVRQHFPSDVQMKLHEALVVFVDSSKWRSCFKEDVSRNDNSVCFQHFVEQRAPSRGLNRYNQYFMKLHMDITTLSTREWN